MGISSTTKLPVVTQSQGTCLLTDTDDTSASPQPWRTKLKENTCLLANTDEPSVSPLPWRTKLKEKRADKKWQSKLNGLQTQIAKSRENLFLLEAALQNTAATSAAVQPEIKPWACLSDWGQEDAIPLPPAWSTEHNTAIVDAGASGLYFKAEAPVNNLDSSAPKITVGTASGDPHTSSTRCELARPELRGKVPIEGHVMPTFSHNLMGICQFCDADCTVQYTKTDVTIFDPEGDPLVKGWRDPGTKL